MRTFRPIVIDMQSTGPVQKRRKRVALLVHTANEWIRFVLRGVAGYGHEVDWDFYLVPNGLDAEMEFPSDWKPDGVITRLNSDSWTKTLLKAGIPAVNVSWMGQHCREIPKVASDERGCAEMAAQHFLDRGFRNFAYVGPINRPGYKSNLGAHYVDALTAAGYKCHAFSPKPHVAHLHRLRDVFRDWVLSLPKPVSVLVWSSDLGRELTHACQAESIDVPSELAVLCVEFDSLMSSLAPVPLSNLNQSGGNVGYEAAKLLHRMMEGAESPVEPIWISPAGIVHRQSSDTMAVADEVVAGAARYIAENISSPIKVQDICDQIHVSRRNLETRFLKMLGRTPAAEIRRARMERVKRLLVETNLPLRAVARQAGFNHTEVMIRNFSKQLGISPGQFRRWHSGEFDAKDTCGD